MRKTDGQMDRSASRNTWHQSVHIALPNLALSLFRAHIRTHKDTHARTCTHTDTHTHNCTHTHTNTPTHTHAHLHSLTHKHMNTRMRDTPSHIHTYLTAWLVSMCLYVYASMCLRDCASVCCTSVCQTIFCVGTQSVHDLLCRHAECTCKRVVI